MQVVGEVRAAPAAQAEGLDAVLLERVRLLGGEPGGELGQMPGAGRGLHRLDGGGEHLPRGGEFGVRVLRHQ
ncbi:hypothetical protein HTV45_01060 [Streptomyces sp. CHD11]|uniref:hypothetical protein n=1 Tax=Streptomyces sp. CHD11 TaxID=2741325 RepID=UPI001BFC2DC3|nr:hypothetical protein [Streptomyces sp. CHD11]MBT3149512.1 hypothetical protein [Streptomyces sp. CHD11]